jgi:alpha-beta hydrolase superfamily lysophospholipase
MTTTGRGGGDELSATGQIDGDGGGRQPISMSAGGAVPAPPAVTSEAEPLWFGPAERPLLGWLDRPADGTARGGVLICPPFGIELSHSHYTLRTLARRLRAAGFAVLRFDYDGTGQSAGEMGDPARVDAWRASVRAGLRVLRDLDLPWLGGVGLRLGATLLADVAAGGALLDGLVLWDPCQSGKAFLRESVALFNAVCPAPDATTAAAGTEILGLRLSEPLAAELRRLELPAAERLAGARVMVLADPTRIGIERLARRLPEPFAEWHEYEAPEPVFDPGELRFDLPERLLGQITGWLDGACDAEPRPLPAPAPGPAPAARVGETPDGTPIVETVTSLGEHGLIGIECAPQTGAEGPAMLLVSLAAESSIGPVRQWVELSRRWAAAGIRSIRLDLSGIGESPIRPDVPERVVYAHEHVDEILGVAAALNPRDPGDVVLVGLCSGAYQVLAAGPRLHPRGVVAVNPILTFAMADRSGEIPTAGPGIPPALGIEPPPPDRRTRWRRIIRARMPRLAWSIVYALRLAHSPAVRLRPLARERVDTLLMLGTNEAEVPLRRTPSVLADLDATGASRVSITPGFDHSLRDQASRDRFQAATTAFLGDILGRPVEPAESVAAEGTRPVAVARIA